MKQERILMMLTSLGLLQQDAQVYLFLATAGPSKAQKISESLHIGRRQLYRSLRRLRRKEVICASSRRSAEFSAVSLEKAIDNLSKPKRKSIQALEDDREKILLKWQSITTDKLQQT